MTRSIDISYVDERNGERTAIEIRSPYDLFGCQRPSKQFWALPVWKELGVEHLSLLGELDPVYFTGWDMMAMLAREIGIYNENIDAIDFEPDDKAAWLAHLVYCYHLLVMTAPKDSVPELCIG